MNENIPNNEQLNQQSARSIAKRHQTKLQKLVLDLNKSGLSLLTVLKFDQAIQFFKKAQKILSKEINQSQNNCKLIQLSGITFNNLACYYKKTKKPKVALKYLKKALQLEVYKLNNWTSIAGTHLNICAIYSYLKNHQQASNHAQLAISFLNKVEFAQDDQSQQAKSYWNVYMLSYYNLAIEKQYQKQISEAIKYYQRAKQIAQLSIRKNTGIIISCDQSIQRLQPTLQDLRKKIISSLKKKQQADEKGFVQYIRKNKKNYSSSFFKKQNTQIDEQQMVQYMKKMAVYNETQTSSGNRFRLRKVLNSTRNGIQQSYNNKNQSVSTFKQTNHNEQSYYKPKRLRILTQNNVQISNISLPKKNLTNRYSRNFEV